jgi:hypothetical protein
VSSRTADNVDARPWLGDAEVLRVQHAPDAPALGADADAGGSPAILGNRGPEAGEFSKDDGKVSPFAGGQSAADVLPKNPGGRLRISDADELVEESGSLSIQARAAASHRKVLAGASSGDQINCCEGISLHLPDVGSGELPGIPEVEHSAARGIVLDLPRHRETRRLQARVQAGAAGEEGADAKAQAPPPGRLSPMMKSGGRDSAIR